MAARSRMSVCGHLLAGILGSNPAGAWMSVSLNTLCCQVEDSTTDRTLVQRSHSECGVSECSHDVSIMRRTLPTGGPSRHGGGGDYFDLCSSHVLESAT